MACRPRPPVLGIQDASPPSSHTFQKTNGIGFDKKTGKPALTLDPDGGYAYGDMRNLHSDDVPYVQSMFNTAEKTGKMWTDHNGLMNVAARLWQGTKDLTYQAESFLHNQYNSPQEAVVREEQANALKGNLVGSAQAMAGTEHADVLKDVENNTALYFGAVNVPEEFRTQAQKDFLNSVRSKVIGFLVL